jgi:glycosyltransferase involved in cell wall biosynthesis
MIDERKGAAVLELENEPSVAAAEVTVIIAAKNEAQNVGWVIDRVKPHVSEVLVVCDRETDPTIAVANAHGADAHVNSYGAGRGKAMRYGVDRARGDILVFMDADGSHNPDDLSAFLEPIQRGDADLVIGSRMKGDSEEFSSNVTERFHLVGNKISSFFTTLVCGAPVSDVHYGMRALTASLARSLNLKEPRMMTELELVIKCFKRKSRIVELPAHELRRRSGKTHIKYVRHVLDGVRCFLKYSW